MMPHDWKGILTSITAPVILFGLFILVLCAVSITVVLSGLSPSIICSIMLGIGALAISFLSLVFLLVWFKPKNLIYSEDSQLKQSELDAKLGTQSKEVSESSLIKEKTKKKTNTDLKVKT
jgi:hypothetical protein